MRKIETIQQTERLNNVFAIDDKGVGNANHQYAVKRVGNDIENLGFIQFQNGPRLGYDSIAGVLDTDLLEIVRDRLISFQEGEFNCGYNEIALNCVTAALEALNMRVEDRVKRNVIGKPFK